MKKQTSPFPTNVDELPMFNNPSEILEGQFAKFEWPGKKKKDGTDEREVSTFEVVKIHKIEIDKFPGHVFVQWYFLKEDGEKKSKIYETLIRKGDKGEAFWVEGITRPEHIWRGLLYDSKRSR